MRKRKRQEKIARIYLAAAEIVCRKGHDATTLLEIGQAVGLTKAGLYHYFQAKNELLYGMLSYAMDLVQREVLDPLAAIPSLDDKLRALTWNYARLIMRNGQHFTRLLDQTNILPAAQARRINRRRRAFYETVRGLMAEAQRTGHIPPHINVSVAALSFFGVLTFTATWYRQAGPLTSEQLAAEITQLVVERMLLASPPSGPHPPR